MIINRIKKLILFQDDPFPTIDTSVTRGCRKPKSLGNDPTSIKMQNKEIWVCRGDLCNAEINEAQPPPYDPIPMDAYKWLEDRMKNRIKPKIKFDA